MLVRALLLASFFSLASAQEENPAQAIQSQAEAFELVRFDPAGGPTKAGIELGRESVVADGVTYDGFRFICPEIGEGRDFVWYFNVPENWSNWYIFPAEGEPARAFEGWKEGDKVYQQIDKPGEKKRYRVLQTLSGSYFTPGEGYIVWFRRMSPGEGTLRIVAGFPETVKDWDHEAIEKALGLEPAPAAEQVAALGSRGGVILLDDRFFTEGYAANRIDSVFFSIRRFTQARGGFFISIKTSVPPCDSDPSLAEIIAEHGEPDLVRTGAELVAKAEHAGGTEPDEHEAGITTSYYDYFGFETKTGDPDRKVLRVSAHGSDFSSLKPKANTATFGVLPTENLTVFHRAGKEVGRIYFFLEDGKLPLIIESPPAESYVSENQELIHDGEGTWEWLIRFEDGNVARRFRLKDNRYSGRAEGYFENGAKRFTADYVDGLLNGEVVQYDEDGQEQSRQTFKDGEPE